MLFALPNAFITNKQTNNMLKQNRDGVMSDFLSWCRHLLVPSFFMNIKWKNHFDEMKGDVGMSIHEKERNKKMPTPTHKATHNSIPTSLFCFDMLFVCLFVSKQHNILTSNCLHENVCCGLGRNKDVGMGL